MLSQNGMIALVLCLFSFVLAQDSHVHTTLNDNVSIHGFTFSYRVSNPEVGKKLYWTIVPESVTKMTLQDIMSGRNVVKGDNCRGMEQENDENKHTVNVRCDFAPGATYRFYISLDDDANVHEGGVAFEVPADNTFQMHADQPKISTTGFVATMSEPAMTQQGYNAMTTTKSAFNVQLSRKPTLKPTLKPSMKPTLDPTTSIPTLKPSWIPSMPPSKKPTLKPTPKPTFQPTEKPTLNPTTTAQPTFQPTLNPSLKPTFCPTLKPTIKPTEKPSLPPSEKPTFKPTFSPTHFPTTSTAPTDIPSRVPTTSLKPTKAPVSLDIGDKVELLQKGKDEPQMGCVMALPEGEGDGKWTVALEDENSGTYLFHMPVAPKLVASSGCLLDAMGDEDQKSDSKKEQPKKEDGQKKQEDTKEEEQKEQEEDTKKAEQKEQEDTKKEEQKEQEEDTKKGGQKEQEDTKQEEQEKQEDKKTDEQKDDKKNSEQKKDDKKDDKKEGEQKKDEPKDDKKEGEQKKGDKKEGKKETEEEKKEKEEEEKSTNKDKANVHALLPNYGGGLNAAASLSRVTDIRNQLQAKVDQMKADLASKGVTMDLSQEEPEHAAASSLSELDHYRSGLSDFDTIGLHNPVPGSLSAPSYSSPVSGSLSAPSYSSPVSETSGRSYSSSVDSLDLPEVPASSGIQHAAYKPLPPLPDVNDAAIDFATHHADSNLLDYNSRSSSFSNPLKNPPSATDSLVMEQMKTDPYLNTEQLHTEVAAGNEPNVFSSLIFTATACLASALLAGILIHKCIRKGDELNMYVLVEEADEEEF